MLINNQGAGEQKRVIYHEMSCNSFMHSVEYEMLKYPKFVKNLNLVACLIISLEETPALCPLLSKIDNFRCKELIYLPNVAAFKYCFGGFVLI